MKRAKRDNTTRWRFAKTHPYYFVGYCYRRGDHVQ
jgi:hypothetical protein